VKGARGEIILQLESIGAHVDKRVRLDVVSRILKRYMGQVPKVRAKTSRFQEIK
jgi:hypothetical protein